MGFTGLRRIPWAAARLLVLPTVLAPGLAAQGAGAAAARSKTRITASSPVSHVQPARDMLGGLVGIWRFEIWFAGNFAGAPDASGTRVVKALFDSLRVEWTETLDHSPIQGEGVVGFDASSDRFFSTAVYSAASAPELLTGIPDDAQPNITFYVIPVSRGTTESPTLSSTLALLDPDHFTTLAADGAWRAVFTRAADGDSVRGVRTRQTGLATGPVARCDGPLPCCAAPETNPLSRAGDSAVPSIIQGPFVAAVSDLRHADSLQHAASIH